MFASVAFTEGWRKEEGKAHSSWQQSTFCERTNRWLKLEILQINNDETTQRRFILMTLGLQQILSETHNLPFSWGEAEGRFNLDPNRARSFLPAGQASGFPHYSVEYFI